MAADSMRLTTLRYQRENPPCSKLVDAQNTLTLGVRRTTTAKPASGGVAELANAHRNFLAGMNNAKLVVTFLAISPRNAAPHARLPFPRHCFRCCFGRLFRQ